jgi:hypothetical protein
MKAGTKDALRISFLTAVALFIFVACFGALLALGVPWLVAGPAVLIILALAWELVEEG